MGESDPTEVEVKRSALTTRDKGMVCHSMLASWGCFSDILGMRFLAFEGLDGAGKSTLIQGLKTELTRQSIAHVLSREPGGTELGADLRELLLRTEAQAPVAKAEALLYQADRAQHVELVIRPALQAGKWVLSDRFAASSIAFQTGGREIDPTQIEWLNEFSTGGVKPDLYILLDLTVAESVKRLQSRGQATDRFEREQKQFHERVRASYLTMAKADPTRWLVLAADESPAVLQALFLKELRERKWLA